MQYKPLAPKIDYSKIQIKKQFKEEPPLEVIEEQTKFAESAKKSPIKTKSPILLETAKKSNLYVNSEDEQSIMISPAKVEKTPEKHKTLVPSISKLELALMEQNKLNLSIQ